MARNATETKRTGTPRASASSLSSDAKMSGRMIIASATKLTMASTANVRSADESTPSTLPNKSAAACVAAAV